MKPLVKTLAIALVALIGYTATSCDKCKGEDPRARIVNNGTVKADVQIKTSGGNTVNINNILMGTSSAFSSFAAGETTFTITIGTTNKELVVQMSQCFEYDITIDANNNVTSVPKDRNE